jgi:cysteine-rich repeat protein
MKFVYPLLLMPFLAGCPFNKCGNNTTDAKEECDDGNEIDADGCEADCSLPVCNNGIKDPGETCFSAPATFGTGTAPTEPDAADLNGDGHQDVITANFSGNSVSVLLGDGTGSFVGQPGVELNSPVFFVAIGDFDGDQIPDFAASLINLNQIQVLSGQGDGTFLLLDAFNTTNPTQLLTADFDKDGSQDLLASSNDGIALFLNDGTGIFEAPRISFIGSNPVISAADFDGDNNLDVAAGVGGNLILLLGDGLGNLAPQAAQLPGEIQGRITAADFNGDQLPDLAITDTSINGSVSLFTNQAATFTLAQTFSVASPFDLVATDLNQDGALDVAIASDLDGNSTAHLATLTSEDETLTAREPLSVGNVNVRGITTADLNEDTIPDVILTNNSNAQIVFFLSQP